MKWVLNDGGRKAAGFTRMAKGDCVIRAIVIASGRPYRQVFDELCALYGGACEGIPRTVYDPYIKSLGFVWVPTMGIGTGCTVHLREGEVPAGTLILRLTRHLCAVIDGTVHDLYDPGRGGMRCVYGYYQKVSK